MADISGGSLSPIYNRLNGTKPYHPLNADTFADPSVEAGDIVTVTRDGRSYESPVHVAKMTWRKGTQVSLSSAGNEERKPLAKMSQKKYARGAGGGSGLRDNMYQHIYVEDVYNQLKSGLELTTSSATLYTQDLYNQMSSGLKLTSSSATMYVNDAYKQLSSGLRMTSSMISMTVQNNYLGLSSAIRQQADKISLVVTDKGEVNTASIVAGINRQDGSFVKIQAAKINLSGYVTAKQLSAVEAEIENLKTGKATAGKLVASSVVATNLTVNSSLTFNYRSYTDKTVIIDGVTYHFLGR